MAIGSGNNRINPTTVLARRLGSKITYENKDHGVSYAALLTWGSTQYLDSEYCPPTGYQALIGNVRPIIGSKVDFYSSTICEFNKKEKKTTDFFNQLIKDENDPKIRMNLYLLLYLISFFNQLNLFIPKLKQFHDELKKSLSGPNIATKENLEKLITTIFEDITHDGNCPINQLAKNLCRFYDNNTPTYKKFVHKKIPHFRTSDEIEEMLARESYRYSEKTELTYKDWIAVTLLPWGKTEQPLPITKLELILLIDRWQYSKTTMKDKDNVFFMAELITEDESKEYFNQLKSNGIINADNTICNTTVDLDSLPPVFDTVSAVKKTHLISILKRSAAKTEPVEYDYLKRKINTMNTKEFNAYLCKINQIFNNTPNRPSLHKKTTHQERKILNEIIAIPPRINQQIPMYSLRELKTFKPLIKTKEDGTCIAIASRILGKNNQVTVKEIRDYIDELDKFKEGNTSFESFMEIYKKTNPKIVLHTILDTATAFFLKSKLTDYLNFMFGEETLDGPSSKDLNTQSYLFSDAFLKSLFAEDQKITDEIKPAILQNLYLEIQQTKAFMKEKNLVNLLLKKLTNITTTLSTHQQTLLSGPIYKSTAKKALFGDELFDYRTQNFYFSRLIHGIEIECPKSLIMLMSVIKNESLITKSSPIGYMETKIPQIFNSLRQLTLKEQTSIQEWGPPHIDGLIMAYNGTNPNSRNTNSYSDIATIHLTTTIISILTAQPLNTNKKLNEFLSTLAQFAIKKLAQPNEPAENMLGSINPKDDAIMLIYSLLTMKNSDDFKKELCGILWCNLSKEIVDIFDTLCEKNIKEFLIVIDILCTSLCEKTWSDDDNKLYASIIKNILKLHEKLNACNYMDWQIIVLVDTSKKTLLDLIRILSANESAIHFFTHRQQINQVTIDTDENTSTSPGISVDANLLDLSGQFNAIIENLAPLPLVTYGDLQEYLCKQFDSEQSIYCPDRNRKLNGLIGSNLEILHETAPREHKKLIDIFSKIIGDLNPSCPIMKKLESRKPKKSEIDKKRPISDSAQNGASSGRTNHGVSLKKPKYLSGGSGSRSNKKDFMSIIKDNLPEGTPSRSSEITIEPPIGNQLKELKHTTNIIKLYLPDIDLSSHKEDLNTIYLNNPGVTIHINKKNAAEEFSKINDEIQSVPNTLVDYISTEHHSDATSVVYDCRAIPPSNKCSESDLLTKIATKFLNGLKKNPEFTIRIYTHQTVAIINRDSILNRLETASSNKLRNHILDVVFDENNPIEMNETIESFIAFLTQTNPSNLTQTLKQRCGNWLIKKIDEINQSNLKLSQWLLSNYGLPPQPSDKSDFAFTALLPDTKHGTYTQIILKLNITSQAIEFLVLDKIKQKKPSKELLVAKINTAQESQWKQLFSKSSNPQRHESSSLSATKKEGKKPMTFDSSQLTTVPSNDVGGGSKRKHPED